MELPTFNEVMKVLHSFVICQQFPVESAVASFSSCQLSGKVANRAPLTAYLCCSTAPMATSKASVTMQVWAFGVWGDIGERHGQGIFDPFEDFDAIICPT